ncbi:MAG: UDP-N-acetylmuramoyl-tripeptide--D-alanyl-D-alanine ligase [Candidatus Kapabacteria bacterium]|nr:UDP-N-acetylmuramoyl-tripeptide--D-alanyl-D-alanine ligase [Candidatus Kapabacteria bacterium]
MTNEATFNYEDLQSIVGSAATHLLQSIHIVGISTDTRSLVPGNAFIALSGEQFDGHDHISTALEKGASLVIVERTPEHFPFAIDTSKILVVPSTLTCLGSFGWYHRRRFTIPVVAIAGAAGKTSTKDLVAHVLSSSMQVLKTQANYNNQIGTPLTLLRLNNEHQAAVIEIGTNEPGEIELLCAMVQPTLGLITNIGKEHLEKLIDLDGVEREETALYDWLRDHNGLALVNMDDERLEPYADSFTRCITFGVETGAEIHPSVSFDAEVRPTIHIVHRAFTLRAPMQTHGLAAAYNATCALAVAWAMQIHPADVQTALMSFETPTGHGYARMKVEHVAGLTILNDSYNANPESMRMALRTLKRFPANRRVAVLGDMRELGTAAEEEHLRMIAEAEYNADVVILMGDEFRKASEIANNSHVVLHETHSGCAVDLRELAGDGIVVLVKGSRGMEMERVIEALS